MGSPNGNYRKTTISPTLCRFVSNPKGLLLASDVAARGLDIPQVQHVIHYQVPRNSEVCVCPVCLSVCVCPVLSCLCVCLSVCVSVCPILSCLSVCLCGFIRKCEHCVLQTHTAICTSQRPHSPGPRRRTQCDTSGT